MRFFNDVKSSPIVAGIVVVLASACMSSAASLTTVVSFDDTNGGYPTAGLIADSEGTLYGTTQAGGSGGYGTVFKLDPTTGSLTTLASFNYISGVNTVGANPASSLLFDSEGNLYGTTPSGGTYSYGTIFKLDPATGTLTTLASFDPNKVGGFPEAGLIADSAGNLYGTTSTLGPYNAGSIFKFDPATNALTTPVIFNGNNGLSPFDGLIADSAGNLYGTTSGGGPEVVYGTVFKLNPNTNTFTTLASFDNLNGGGPSGLIADSKGNFYGTSSRGGANGNGSVFSFDPVSSTITTLASFDYQTNGSFPQTGVIADAAGNLYGTTFFGGASGDGTVFKLDINTDTLSTLAVFDGTNGASPLAGLFADSAGNLFGTTSGGGASDDGTVFEITGSGFVVPEPSGFVLMALSAVAVLHRRRKPISS